MTGASLSCRCFSPAARRFERRSSASAPPRQRTALRQPAVAEARAYFERALAYLDPPPARLLAIGGLSGTGKSTLARLLAPGLGPAPGAVILRSDVARKRLHGVAPGDRLPPEAYRKEASGAVYDALAARAAALVGAGHAAIVDAVFLDPKERAQIEAVAAAAGVRFDGLWLCAPEERVGGPRRGAPGRRLGRDARSRAAATGYRPRRDVVAGPGGERPAGGGCGRGAKSISLGTSRSYANRNVASRIAKAKPTVDEHRAPAPHPAHKA